MFNKFQFTDGKFSTAKEKARFANQFVRFVKSNFDLQKFTKCFYERLMNTCSHIAHYNQNGFYHTWFNTGEDRNKFITRWIENPVYGDPKYTYSDVERALKQWLIDGDWQRKQLNRSLAFDAAIDEKIAIENKRKEGFGSQTHQEFIVAAKSQNTNSFGLHRYIMVARDGTAWAVLRTLSFPWETNQILQVPLVKGEATWGSFGVECPEKISNPEPELLEKIWANAA